MHMNIRTFLEDKQCSDCFKITGIKLNPDGTRDIDIRIKHPWAGLDTFTGFDVRAIAMWNGSKTWPSSGLITQDPDGDDGYVSNADGYTTIFNPTNFPFGSAPPLFTYSKGKFATSTLPDSTLNPYIDYFTDENRHFFSAGESVTRTWNVRFPSGGPLVLGYAVDACWSAPLTSPPENIPEDFPQNANRPEPYRVEISQTAPLPPDDSSDTDITVKVWDWQNNQAGASIECPSLWDGIKYDKMVAVGPEYTIFYIPVINEKSAPAGVYRALVGARDSSSDPKFDLTTYSFYDVVVEEYNECCNNPPVAVAEVNTTSVIVGEDVVLASLAYDPDGDDCLTEWEWDLENDGFYDESGTEVTVSYDLPGTYEIQHRVTNSCDLMDELDTPLSVVVSEDCCVLPPVAVIENNTPHVITDQKFTLESLSYDPESDNCPIQEGWDTDGDGVYDDASGSEAVLSFATPGIMQIKLQVLDDCGLKDIASTQVHVHPGITQPEDADYKKIDTKYIFKSIDLEVSEAAFAVDMSDKDGPWDFSLLSLEESGNYRAILSGDHPETDPFKDDFLLEFDHFVKTEGIYNMVEGALYIAEKYVFDPDSLHWVGFHEDDSIGTIPLDNPFVQDFPFWVFSSSELLIGMPPFFTMALAQRGWGEGTVTVPWGGVTVGPCTVIQYELDVSSPDVDGSVIAYDFVLDNGTVVAIVAAINTADEVNYDPETGEITGVATFNALDVIQLY